LSFIFHAAWWEHFTFPCDPYITRHRSRLCHTSANCEPSCEFGGLVTGLSPTAVRIP